MAFSKSERSMRFSLKLFQTTSVAAPSSHQPKRRMPEHPAAIAEIPCSPPLVNFVLAGVQKGGTTSLDACLRQHPQLCMAQQKEPHFFDTDLDFPISSSRLSEFHALFTKGPEHRLCGEATPIYTFWESAISRIWQYNPAMKLLVLLRDPVQRAWSHWRMENRRGSDDCPFSIAIRQNVRRCTRSLPLQDRVYSYVERGFYSEQIRRIYRFFPPEQVLFIKSEEFFANPQESFRNACRFLEIEELDVNASEKLNAGPDLGEMPVEDKVYLRELYRHDVEQVKALLGWKCGDWLA